MILEIQKDVLWGFVALLTLAVTHKASFVLW